MVSMEQPWANITALGPKAGWASAVEEEEAAAGGKLEAPNEYVKIDEDAFPSLGAAASKPSGGKKKKPSKGVKLALGDFMGGRDDRSILQNLPKAPRGDGEHFDDRGDRGFDRGNRGGFGGGGGRFDRDGGYDRDDYKPSVADGSSNWGADRKPFVPEGRGGGFGGAGSRGGFGDGAPQDGRSWDRGANFQPSRGSGFGDNFGRADEAGQWDRGSQFQPRASGGDRGGGFGGFRDAQDGPRGGGFREREGGFHEYQPSRADEETSWGRAKPERPPVEPRTFGASGLADVEDRWSRGTAVKSSAPSAPGSDGARSTDGDRWTRRDSPVPGEAAAVVRPTGERPRLVLAPRTKPLPDQLTNLADTEKKSSIFGEARPREAVLKEQGRDYLEEERQRELAEQEQRERRRTKEELALQEEIELLRTRIEAGEADVEVEVEGGDDVPVAEEAGPDEKPEGEVAGAAREDAEIMTVQTLLEHKEKQLEELSAALDEKMRNRKDQPRPPRREREAKASEPAAWKRPTPAGAPVAAPPAPADAVDAKPPPPTAEPTAEDAGKENDEAAEAAVDPDDGFQEVGARGKSAKRDSAWKEGGAPVARDRDSHQHRTQFAKERREETVPAAAAPKGSRW